MSWRAAASALGALPPQSPRSPLLPRAFASAEARLFDLGVRLLQCLPGLGGLLAQPRRGYQWIVNIGLPRAVLLILRVLLPASPATCRSCVAVAFSMLLKIPHRRHSLSTYTVPLDTRQPHRLTPGRYLVFLTGLHPGMRAAAARRALASRTSVRASSSASR